MTAFLLVVHRLAQVVQQPGAAGDFGVQAQLGGHHLRQVRHFHRVFQHVLAVTGPEAEPAQKRQHLFGQVRQVGLLGRVTADFQQRFFHLLRHLGVQLFDAGGVNAAVLHQAVERDAGDLPPHRVEAADDDHARRVVDDHVHAGRLLERPDVPPLAADHAALHGVVADGDRADRVVGRLLAGVPLDGRQDDLPGTAFALFLGLLDVLLDHQPDLAAALVFHAAQQQFLRRVRRQVRDRQQPVPLFGQHAGQFGLLLLDQLRLLGQLGVQVVQIPLLDAQRVQLAVDGRLALVQPQFLLVQLAPAGGQFLVDDFLGFELLLLGDQFDLAGLGFGFEQPCPLRLFGVLFRPGDDVAAGVDQPAVQRGRPGQQSQDQSNDQFHVDLR